MSTATRAIRPTGSASPTQARTGFLAGVSREVKKRPSAVILFGPPGVGKTETAASMPGVVFLIDPQEDGINRLKESGSVPATIPVLPQPQNFPDVLATLEELRTAEHDFRSIAVDALGGIERLCHEEVCRRDFNGEWGDRGFGSYAKGYDVALTDWRLFLGALDRLRDERNMGIMLLGHSRIAPFKNPEGPDFDRYSVDVHHKTWSLTHKWADMVLFSNYEIAFAARDEAKPKAKARGGQVRMMYTEYHAAYDAKNRHNLAPEIPMGSSGREAWANLCAAILAGRKEPTNG